MPRPTTPPSTLPTDQLPPPPKHGQQAQHGQHAKFAKNHPPSPPPSPTSSPSRYPLPPFLRITDYALRSTTSPTVTSASTYVPTRRQTSPPRRRMSPTCRQLSKILGFFHSKWVR